MSDTTRAPGQAQEQTSTEMFAAGPWVPVGERLPGTMHPAVLVTNGKVWDRAIWEPYGWIGTRNKNITHWAEIRMPGGER